MKDIMKRPVLGNHSRHVTTIAWVSYFILDQHKLPKPRYRGTEADR